MSLSAEDSLRLNVMLANKPQAIRVDESRMQVWSLGEKGEARVDLCPNCRDEQYIKQVRELLSGHVLGSPGGYPVYIKRWTRMGQMKDDSLEHLLLLGEPEAVVAAVHAAGLTDELARRAWWIMEDAENARQMLSKECVVCGDMGPVLANWLIEFLPFETEADKMMESVRLVLQGNLVSPAQMEELWKKARRKPAFYVGFLASAPDQLPVQKTAHGLFEQCQSDLVRLADEGNGLAAVVQRVLSPAGQSWVDTLLAVLEKPANQDVVNTVLDVAADYFAAVRPEGVPDQTFEELQGEAQQWLDHPDDELVAVLASCSGLSNVVKSMRILSGLSYGVVRPVFKDSTAIGSLMRKKLAPVFDPLKLELKILRGQ
ncbi:MAG: sulfur reduction protein DsrS [bacterium]